MVKDDAGAVSVETVLDEIAKLQQLRALGLPEGLFPTRPRSLSLITGRAPRANRLVSYGGIRPTYVTRSWLRCAGNDNRKSPTA